MKVAVEIDADGDYCGHCGYLERPPDELQQCGLFGGECWPAAGDLRAERQKRCRALVVGRQRVKIYTDATAELALELTTEPLAAKWYAGDGYSVQVNPGSHVRVDCLLERQVEGLRQIASERGLDIHVNSNPPSRRRFL